MPRKKSVKKGDRPSVVGRKKPTKKEKVCEIFEVDKSGGEKVVKSCGEVAEEPASKEEMARNNRILRNVLIFIGVVAVVFLVGWLTINSIRHFEYRGVKFDVVKEGELILYRTAIPVSYNGGSAMYNFYLRNDPRKLDEEIPFYTRIGYYLSGDVVVNMSENFDCDGDAVIAVANMVKLLQILGTDVLRDEKASCDMEGRYSFIDFKNGNSSSIKQTGPTCYNFEISDCDILKVTERFMAETFVEINQEQ